MNEDFAYLVGALGDACFYQNARKGHYCVEYEQKNRAWLEQAIIPRMMACFGRTPRLETRKSGLFRTRLNSKQAFEQLQCVWADVSIFENEAPLVQSAFIRGFFDSDGSAPRRRVGESPRIEFYQKDAFKLEVIARILASQGFHVLRLTNSRDVAQLILRGRENVGRFWLLVGCEHPDKEGARLDFL